MVMKNIKFYIGIIFLAIAAVILLYVEDVRALYSGGFFTVLGSWLIISDRRKSRSERSDE
jgi:hypothetical protein